MTLAELIAVRQESIVRRFVTHAASTEGAPAVGRAKLIDSVPSFLRELVIALRRVERESRASAHEEIPAREHGRQRFALGFDLEAVIEDYGALFEIILAMVSEENIQLTIAEVGELSRAHQLGVAEAVHEYLANARTEAPSPAPPARGA